MSERSDNSSQSELPIDDHQVVAVHYRLSNALGEVIDSSLGGLPLVYMHNSGALLPSLERELTGRRAGEEFEVYISTEEGYGERDPELVEPMPLSAFDQPELLEPGMRFRATRAGGEEKMLTVVAREEDHVVVDANHPLAGQVLHFQLAVVGVRLPQADELEQGYAISFGVDGPA